MSFQLVWDKKSKDFLKKINKDDAQRIIKKLNKIIENPRHYLDTLVDISAYKLRLGSYRIIVDLDEKNKILNVLFIGLRKNIYKYIKREVK